MSHGGEEPAGLPARQPARDHPAAQGDARSAALRVASVARPARAFLDREPFQARVGATFARSWLLFAAGGDVLALVLPQVGDGPLNALLAGEPAALAALEVGMAARRQGDWLHLGPVAAHLAGAATWEPCPNWNHLRGQPAQPACLAALQNLALERAPGGSLLSLLGGRLPAPAEDERARLGLAALRQGWAGDLSRLREGAAALAGLGRGLTPAGDDLLAGAMLRAWLQHPAPAGWCGEILQVAAPRTTLLSAAFLRAASRGECSAAWHDLLPALTAVEGDLALALSGVLAHGHTSGADMLAGFLSVSN